MIRKIFFILIIIGTYIGVMSVDDGDALIEKFQGSWKSVIEKLEDWGFRMHINKWVYDNKRKRIIVKKIIK